MIRKCGARGEEFFFFFFSALRGLRLATVRTRNKAMEEVEAGERQLSGLLLPARLPRDGIIIRA